MSNTNGGEKIWKWTMRACAVIGYAALLIKYGLEVPTTFYFLIIGLFFGPEILKGKIKLISKDDDPDA